jgi:formylglycine-generating enzyme
MKAIPSVAVFSLAFALSAAAYGVTIPTVLIGNPGNPADTRNPEYQFHPNGIGSVDYEFRIGATEVSNSHYVEFLNAVAATDPYGLYNAFMASDTRGGIVRSGVNGNYTYTVKVPALSVTYTYDEKPVVFVSSGDAMRFVNWLHNGQPAGPQDASTTEDGAYTLHGAVTEADLSVVIHNPGARWWLPTEDEWYKAAYHKSDGVTGNYWDYPTRTNSAPNNHQPSADTGNSANFSRTAFSGYREYPLTDVGAYTLSSSPYGTLDQGGNVAEWNETSFGSSGGQYHRSVRGGDWSEHHILMSTSIVLSAGSPTTEDNKIGFRVASVPEPSTPTAVVVLLAALHWRQSQTLRRRMRVGISVRRPPLLA